MTRWAVVADLERCVGCQTCAAACRHANSTSPAVQWRKVLDIEAGSYPAVIRAFVPVGCQHCADPPCVHVCPTTASRRRSDGIVTIDHDLCIGCAYCEVACPYQARFLEHVPHYAYGTATQNEAERAHPERYGVAQKCTFCSDRVDFGLANGFVPGADPRATPACVNSCIAEALHFGDADDPNSNVSQLLREQRHFRMHEELGTDPGFYYLYGKADDPESQFETEAPAAEAGHLRLRGAEPQIQQHWDWKAAGNFICGGAGTGLYAGAALAGAQDERFHSLGWLALALVALGLVLVLLKIGRPLRAMNVLRQPQRSWMTREAWLAAAFFPLGATAILWHSPALAMSAALLGLLFLVSQAMILKEARGIPAWRTPAIVPLVVSTGLAEGVGLLLAAAALLGLDSVTLKTIAATVLMLGAVRSWFWRSYLKTFAMTGAPVRALAALEGIRGRFFIAGIAVPLLLAVVGFINSEIASPLFVAAGISVAGAGAALKFILITRAGFSQGFALKHTPVRGRGIAGPAVRPGWS